MSTAELRVVKNESAMDRLVEVALRLENDENVDHWELADSTLDAVEERGANAVDGISGRGHSTGLFAVLDEIRHELTEAGATQVASKRTLRNAYSTARAWAPEDRVDGANYWAHYELAGSKWENRKRILNRLVDEHRRNGRKGLIGTPEVRLRKSVDNKPDLRSRDVKLDAGLRSVLRRWASPQSFTQLHNDEQDAAVRILESLANEIRSGGFS